MGVRVRPIGSNWIQPYLVAAQLKAQAGAALGQGYSNLGQSIGAGLAGLGQRKRSDKMRAEDMQFRERQFGLEVEKAEMDREREGFQILGANLGVAKKAEDDIVEQLTAEGVPIEAIPSHPKFVEAHKRVEQIGSSMAAVGSRVEQRVAAKMKPP